MFYYIPSCLPNQLLFDLILSYSQNSPIKLDQLSFDSPHLTYNSCYDHELEIWPTVSNGIPSSILARDYFQIPGIETDLFNADSFLPYDPALLEEAEQLFRPHLKADWFAGLHFRTAVDGRSLRNTSIQSINQVVNHILSSGGQPFLVSYRDNLVRSLGGLVTCLPDLATSRREYELLQLYIWVRSTFFCGSQSGGTLPPSLFGTPILWLDFHPSAHVTWLNTNDVYVPRSIYSLELRRFLTHEESISPVHKFCQSECPRIAFSHGYKVSAACPRSITKAFNTISQPDYRNQHHRCVRYF
ncbi:TIGR04372 family glycosyltransferase [Cyanobium sp. WAJ14-Wanaka]|nr:TIGR04372 family glycosyltransferase [Cyanobium sp. WAJ14-Wanaka]